MVCYSVFFFLWQMGGSGTCWSTQMASQFMLDQQLMAYSHWGSNIVVQPVLIVRLLQKLVFFIFWLFFFEQMQLNLFSHCLILQFFFWSVRTVPVHKLRHKYSIRNNIHLVCAVKWSCRLIQCSEETVVCQQPHFWSNLFFCCSLSFYTSLNICSHMLCGSALPSSIPNKVLLNNFLKRDRSFSSKEFLEIKSRWEKF